METSEIQSLKNNDLAHFMPLKKNFTVEEVSVYFSCSAATIKRRCRNGQIEAIKIGKIWRISRTALSEFIRLNTDRGQLSD
ncbi:MAG: helix-turn-helix domain-containing protein [Deferribacterales bacterium]